MRLINGEERNANRLKRLEKAAAAKAFGRNVDQFELAAAQSIDARALFRPSIELLMNVAGSPRERSASTWSFMRAMRGETTTVAPPSIIAGS